MSVNSSTVSDMSGKEIIVLQTYDGTVTDGLSKVFDFVRPLGKLVDDTSTMKHECVLVAGIPHLYTNRLSPENHNIVFTTFETDSLPAFWVDCINHFYDSCIVPDKSVKTVFATSGVTVPISVVHQSFTRFPRVAPRSLGNEFRVGFIGVPVARKNLLELYRACCRLKSDISNIKLIVHVSEFYDWINRSEFEQMKQDEMVEWSEGVLSDDELVELYSSLSCYVFPSSGEGWSFTPRESLYLGVPTVLSDIPLHKELIDSGYCVPIAHSDKFDADFDGMIFGKWYRIEEQKISVAIQETYDKYDEIVENTKQGAAWIANKWTHESMLDQIRDIAD